MGAFFSVYDNSLSAKPSENAMYALKMQEEQQRRNIEKKYGFKLPQELTPQQQQEQARQDSFFSSMSKYMPQSGGGGSGGVAAPPNVYENKLRDLMSNPDSIANSADYKFRFNQGQQALERSAAARGMGSSGNVLAELAKYGQGMASNAYGAEADRLAGMSNQANQFQLGKEQNQIAREGNAIKNMATMYDMYNKTPRFVIA